MHSRNTQLKFWVNFLVVCLCLWSANVALGQGASTGSVQGTITDPSNAAVAGATITLTDVSTNTERTAVTNDAGRYIFPNVPPGAYTVSIEKTGFRTTKFVRQAVSVGTTLTLDAQLALGSMGETVEVMAATGAELQTTNATISNTISGVALTALPGLGRDASTFVTLQPGVAPDGSVAGANQDQNTFQLDGGNNSSDMDGTQNTYT